MNFWKSKSIFVTGHTGFKGSWLIHLLACMGARVHGYALKPELTPNIFEALNAREYLASHEIGDICDASRLYKMLTDAEPEIVFHLAAQPLVRASYLEPIKTYATNVMGTAHLLEAIRHTPSVRAAVFITTDKVYRNQEWMWPYRECETLGGHDPYSASKACSELVIDSYRKSFFSSHEGQKNRVFLASSRAGNIIGGGDWSKDRLIPDIIRAVELKRQVAIRHPSAIRPWQHVLEPLMGYLNLAQRLYEERDKFADAWNFGPKDEDCQNVEKICDLAKRFFGERLQIEISETHSSPHEANFLKLDSTKARLKLGWQTYFDLETAVYRTFCWYDHFLSGKSARQLVEADVAEYSKRSRMEIS